MRITILSVTLTDKGKYKELDIAYKDPEGKTQGKRLMSFSQKDTFVILGAAVANEVYDVKPVKNEKGFWDWVEAVKVSPETSVPTAANKIVGSPRSTYETPEERFQRQVYIIRQSSLDRAIDYYNLTGHKKATLADVLGLAESFTEFVFGGFSKSVEKNEDPEAAIAAMKDDIPY